MVLPCCSFPTAAADYLEYERLMGNTGAVYQWRESKSVLDQQHQQSWLNNNEMLGEHKAIRHNQFNEYVFNEVIPLSRTALTRYSHHHLRSILWRPAQHESFLKRPDLINGVIAMSGVYDLTGIFQGFLDEQVYFNSPMHYMGNLTDHHILNRSAGANHIHILTGSGAFHEDPNASRVLPACSTARESPMN